MQRRTRRVLSLGTAISILTLGLVALTATQSAQASSPTHAFPSHQTYKLGVMPSASQATRDAAVEHQYDSWKSTYLHHGCASNEYYVSTLGDSDARNNGPVSEGQGYGMNIVPLMAGYDASAQTEFNGLWQLVKDHLDQWGMMEWQLDGNTCQYYSSGTPDAATDGDLDIGYGLILADKQWGGYQADALNWLAKFWQHDVTSDGHLKCEDDGPSTDTRPSDHMIDHLRAFAAYDTSHDWNKVIQRTETIDSYLVSHYSSSYGLLSDFVVGANGSTPSPASSCYQECQPDNIVGYNSIRVPWHMGTDALLNGTASTFELSDAQKWSACAKKVSGGSPGKVYPHLNLNCTPYSTSDVAEEAGDSIGPAAMASGDQAWTDSIWNFLQTNPYSDHYYGETIKTLVMIVMAGDWWSPTGSTPPPPNDFSISDSPSSGSVTQGSSTSATISTAVTSGSAESVSLSASGLPSGATATFNPTSVNSGGSSTLTIATSSTTPTGTYSITVTGAAASGSHSVTYSLTVNPVSGGCTPAQLFGNPGFENGTNTAPWTQTSTLGYLPITQATSQEPSHSGSWIAWFNGNATKDTDTIQQTVSIPSGCGATLSYWLHVDSTEKTTSAKPDTFTVQVLNSSGTVLATVGSFSNLDAATGYTQRSADLSAYAGQTVAVKFIGSETDTYSGTTDFVVDDTALNTH